MNGRKKKVLVALSGGVDSSVSAALLQREGYDVSGAFIKTWTAPWLPCTWREERRDAMRVAAHLHIPFHTVDLSKEYERDVVQYLVREYREGRTPNPDVMCNKYVKFGGLFDWAQARGFEYLATGHYAQVDKVQEAGDDKGSGTHHLLMGEDKNKDQSYFLWTLTQKHLAKTLFPVGSLEKPHVRELAVSFGLTTATKKDSQGVCFLGKLDMKEFLGHYIEGQPGDVLDSRGEKIGRHDGAWFYTLGQRHGFTVAHTGTNDEPVYVISKNVDENTITVAPRSREVRGGEQIIRLANVNWIAGTPITQDTELKIHHSYYARLRYRQPLFPVRASVEKDSVVVIPDTPELYVPLGQSLVLYDKNVCLGGGTIVSSE